MITTRPARIERLLVVNADDYGLTEGTCQAILEAHQQGIVTSTSVLASGRAFPRCGRWLLDHPELGVGVHLAVVGDETPVLPPTQVPSLVDANGRFSRSWRTLLARWVVRPVDTDELTREFAAQVERVSALGIRVTHLDSHQHVHLLPGVREAVLAVAARFCIPVIRIPRAKGRRRWGRAVNALARSLRSRIQHAGLTSTGDTFGFDEAGGLDDQTLAHVLDEMASSPARTFELIVHPGPERDPERDRYTWGYRWADELGALTRVGARERLHARGFTLVTHAAVAGVATAEAA